MKQQEMPSVEARVKATLCQQPLQTALETGADRHLCSLPSGSLLSEKEDVCGSIVGLLGPAYAHNVSRFRLSRALGTQTPEVSSPNTLNTIKDTLRRTSKVFPIKVHQP